MKLYIVIFLVLIIKNVQNVPKRLPESIKPFRYNITLEPDLFLGDLKGIVDIGILVQTNTTNITIHARFINITVNQVAVINSTGHKLNVTGITKDDDNDFYTIILGNTLIQGQRYNLSITNYTGSLNHKDNIGFCLIRYYDQYGKERRIATTQFQAHGARRTFPCFDEPHFKSRFYINIIRRNNYKSVSNQPLINTRNLDNDRFCDEFKDTLNMSTYSAAFVVTDYDSTITKKGQRIFADVVMPNPDATRHLNEGVEMLSKLENYIGVGYSLSKIDSIALPDEYVLQRGMKSWGLLCYRNSNLIYTRDTLTNYEKQTDILKMSEGYSQQWFGNLISPSGWNYVWLNEGFRNFYKYIGAALMGWDMMDQYSIQCVQHALSLESSLSAKSLNSENAIIEKETNVRTYQKAGAIVRMMEHFLTKEVFQKGVRLYLQNNAFKAVKPSHLYQAFQRIIDIENHHHLLGNQTVSSIMRTWDSQAGYPIINVQRQYSINTLTITQSRFLMEPNETVKESVWYIPLTYTTEEYSKTNFSSTITDLWMTEKEVIIEGVLSRGWIIFNKQQSGFYRVNYDYENWNRMIDTLCRKNVSTIHALSRAQLLDDAFNLAYAGQLSFNTAFDLSRYIQRELSYIPISAFLLNVMVLRKKLSEENGHDNLHLFVGDVLNGEAINYLTNDENKNDTHLEKLNRVQILSALCTVGNQRCRNYALNTFRLWIKDPIDYVIVPNLESVVFCGAMHIGNQKDWDLLYEKYKTTKNVLRKRRILMALGCSKNNDTLKGFLNIIFGNESDMDPNDKLPAFKSMYSEKFRVSFVFNYIIENFGSVRNAFQDEVLQILTELAERLTTAAQLQQMEALSSKYPWLSESFKGPINIVKNNIEFNNKYGKTIKNWLSNYVANRKSGSNTKELNGILKFLLIFLFIIAINKY